MNQIDQRLGQFLRCFPGSPGVGLPAQILFRQFATEQLAQGQTEAVNVAGPVHIVTIPQLLGSHVLEGPHGLAVGCQVAVVPVGLPQLG